MMSGNDRNDTHMPHQTRAERRAARRAQGGDDTPENGGEEAQDGSLGPVEDEVRATDEDNVLTQETALETPVAGAQPASETTTDTSLQLDTGTPAENVAQESGASETGTSESSAVGETGTSLEPATMNVSLTKYQASLAALERARAEVVRLETEAKEQEAEASKARVAALVKILADLGFDDPTIARAVAALTPPRPAAQRLRTVRGGRAAAE